MTLDDLGTEIGIDLDAGDAENFEELWRAEAEDLYARTTLSRREAQVWLLRRKYELSHGDVAEVLPIERSTSGEYNRRANRKLREARTMDSLGWG